MRTGALRQSLRVASIAADAALERYRLDVVDRRLLAHTHNTTYRLTLRDGSRAVLKIRCSANNEMARQRSEMQWLEALSQQTDLLVPRPIRNRAGELVTAVAVDGIFQPHLCR